MADYDILIKNGSLADGTGAPLREADIAVNGDKIAAVGKISGDAKVVIDAKNKIVSPGFIDIHGHSDYFILIEPGSPSKLFQGVTTEIGGNCGYSSAPVSDELSRERGESLDSNFGLKPDWNSLEQYYRVLEKTGPAINFGILIGHNTVRASVMSGAARPPDESEMRRMIALVREAMDQGALGISTGLIYPPGCFADGAELATLCKPVAESGGFFATHIRSEGRQLIESIEEVIEASKIADIRLQISHLKTSGLKNWGKIDRAIELIEQARASGFDVRCDRYPYTASFTGLSSTLPSWAFEGSREEYRARLKEAAVRAKLKSDILENNGDDYLSKVVVAQVFSDANRHLEGFSVTDAAAKNQKDPYEFLFDILSQETSDPTAIYHTMSEGNMTRILNLPYCSVGSDSSVRRPGGPLGTGKPHPRSYGCFPRMIRLALDDKIMPIETAIKKMSGDPADAAGIEKRGTLIAGNFADILVFDPGKVRDVGTYDDPHRLALGMEYVFVNGKAAISDGRLTGDRPGKVVYRKRSGK